MHIRYTTPRAITINKPPTDLKQRSLEPSTTKALERKYIPKLKASLPDSGNITNMHQLQSRLNDFFKDNPNVTQQEIMIHIETIENYHEAQKTIICNLYDVILNNAEPYQIDILSEYIKSICFPGLENALSSFAHTASYPAKTSSPFERWLNIKIMEHINTFTRKIVDTINKDIFFNASDPQSSHQQEPVRKYLDETYNLYQGEYPEDEYNKLTPYGKQVIEKSITKLTGLDPKNHILSLNSWIDFIDEQLTQDNLSDPNSVPCCGSYINELYQLNINPTFNQKLNDVLDEMLESDNPDTTNLKNLGNKFLPKKNLIRLILQNTLNEPSQNKEKKSEQSAPFCLRNGISETLLKAAHEKKESIIETMISTDKKESICKNWVVENKVLFLHIIGNRFKDDIEFFNLIPHLIENHFFRSDNISLKTPLFIAAENGYIEGVKILSNALKEQRYLDPEPMYLMKNNHDKTPLHIAAENGHTEIVTILLDSLTAEERLDYLMINTTHDRDTNFITTPLHLAAKNGHTQIVTILLAELTKNIFPYLKKRDHNSYNPLHLATKNGHTNVVSALLTKLKNPAQQDKMIKEQYNGNTPLHIAAEKGHTEIVMKLLDSTENVYQYLMTKNNKNATSLYIAVENGHPNVVSALLAKLENHPILQANIIKNKNNKSTPLDIAIENGHTQIVTILLNSLPQEQRLDYLNTANKMEDTALHIAAKKGHTQIVTILLDSLTPEQRLEYLNTANKMEDTALHLAAKNGHTQIVTILLDSLTPEQYFEYLTTADQWGDTPLHSAAENGHTEVIKSLFKRLKPEKYFEYLIKTNNRGDTPLHLAIYNSSINSELVIKLLVTMLTPKEQLTYLKIKNNDNLSPTSLAKHVGPTFKHLAHQNPNSYKLLKTLKNKANSGNYKINSKLLRCLRKKSSTYINTI